MTMDSMDEVASAQAKVWGLLAMARQLISDGKPSLALQAVVAFMRAQGGEQAALLTLERARELYRRKMQADTTADELAYLFAECAITEIIPSNPDPPLPLHAGGPHDVGGTSILATSGRQQVMMDAFADGSSFVCLQCGGLVSNLRREEHLAYWCGHI